MALLNHHGRRDRRYRPTIAVVWLAATALLAQAPPPDEEYRVKAAFLYNFAKFVQWPEREGTRLDKFVIGILGENPFGQTILELVRGKTLGAKPIEVQIVRDVKELSFCHVLFISGSERGRVERVLQAVEGAGVLTVSELDGFVPRGGMIHLFLENNRVRFSINQKAVRRGGLKVSSKLLALAKSVEGDDR